MTSTRTRFALGLFFLAAFLPAAPGGAQILAVEDFENDLSRWRLDPPGPFEIVAEPGGDNHVLQLSPLDGGFAYALLAESTEWRDVRVEGRFLFPTEGDGYLGFLYNYQRSVERLDFGCLYVKSNGSYVRVSPHYDGNPSWRLHEEMRFDLAGERRIQVGEWYPFRLDVRSNRAELFVGDLTEPVRVFDLFPNTWGAVGLEPRPGGGEPVWVDDFRVSRLAPLAQADSPAGVPATVGPPGGSTRLAWQVLGPLTQSDLAGFLDDDRIEPEALPAEGWRPIEPDRRGMLVTGLVTQYRSGERNIALLRSSFEVAEGETDIPAWLAVSSANRVDVWLNGWYRGTVAPERFIWSDYLTSSGNPGARLPISPRAGRNELLLRVDGDRFAGGGLYVALDRAR